MTTACNRCVASHPGSGRIRVVMCRDHKYRAHGLLFNDAKDGKPATPSSSSSSPNKQPIPEPLVGVRGEAVLQLTYKYLWLASWVVSPSVHSFRAMYDAATGTLGTVSRLLHPHNRATFLAFFIHTTVFLL